MLPRIARAGVRKSLSWGLIAGVLLMAVPCLLRAQEPGEQGGGGRGMFAGMQRAQGEVTEVSGADVTLRDADGNVTVVVTTANTRIMTSKMTPEKVAEIKVGDGAMAMGQLDAPNKTLHAAMLFTTDAATLKAMKENLGKTYIAGRVVSVDLDNAKMVVERADKVQQTIAFDETTSFRRGRPGRGGGGMGGGGMMGGGMGPGGGMGGGGGAPQGDAGESITLADIKVGDGIYGTGVVKSGTFVPAQVVVGTPRAGGRPARPMEPAK